MVKLLTSKICCQYQVIVSPFLNSTYILRKLCLYEFNLDFYI